MRILLPQPHLDGREVHVLVRPRPASHPHRGCFPGTLERGTSLGQPVLRVFGAGAVSVRPRLRVRGQAVVAGCAVATAPGSGRVGLVSTPGGAELREPARLSSIEPPVPLYKERVERVIDNRRIGGPFDAPHRKTDLKLFHQGAGSARVSSPGSQRPRLDQQHDRDGLVRGEATWPLRNAFRRIGPGLGEIGEAKGEEKIGPT